MTKFLTYNREFELVKRQAPTEKIICKNVRLSLKDMRRNQVHHHKFSEGTHQKAGTVGPFHKITRPTSQPLPAVVCTSKNTFDG